MVKKRLDSLKSNGISVVPRKISSLVPRWIFSYDRSKLITANGLNLLTREYSAYVDRFAGLKDVELFEKAGVDKSIVRHRLERGDTCVIVLKDNRLVAWSWAATGELFTKTSGTIINTGDSGVFLYDVYTVPEERLKGFIMTCFKRQLEFYIGKNRLQIFGIIDAFNKPSLRTHLRMGFEIGGETTCVSILGINFCYYHSWFCRRKKWNIFTDRQMRHKELV